MPALDSSKHDDSLYPEHASSIASSLDSDVDVDVGTDTDTDDDLSVDAPSTPKKARTAPRTIISPHTAARISTQATESPSPRTEPKASQSSSRAARAKADPSASPKRSPKPWTSEEMVKLFDAAVKSGASDKAFEGVIDGRTGKQCYGNWRMVIAPAIRKMLEERGKRGKTPKLT